MKPLRKKTFLILAAAVIGIFAVGKLTDPRVQARAFVAVYGDRIEAACADGLVEPDGIPAVDIDLYHGRYEHEMIEFMLGQHLANTKIHVKGLKYVFHLYWN